MFDYWLFDNNGCASPVKVISRQSDGEIVQINGSDRRVFWSHESIELWRKQNRLTNWHEYRNI